LTLVGRKGEEEEKWEEIGFFDFCIGHKGAPIWVPVRDTVRQNLMVFKHDTIIKR